ncbi:g6570 [Coccomyxa viridis]|uniref:G6570 protein n=1 Tax=Coccomyxa viridis TaxID=1274662 RepID=A0ABP1FY13_9CHLO
MKGFALVAGLVIFALAARSDAQAVSVTSVPEVNVTMQTGPFNPIILYGLKPAFSATILSNGSLPSTTACPFLWMNGTQTISVLPQFSQASTSSAINGGLAFTWIEPNLLSAGIYNSVQGVFQGCTVNGVTYLPSTSATQVGYFPAFVQILPASTALSAAFTPFTLANFTQSIMVNLTNVNGTNQNPTGASYEVITDSSGNVVGNFSLTSTPITANANALTLPSTFNATQLLHTGSYTAVITYYPTINFTQPVPLTITFSITNVPVTAPPPPPVVPTPPPPPAPVPVPPVVPPPPPAPLSPPSPPAPSGCQNGSTTITVEVFYNQVTDFLKQCQSRSLYFVANVRSTCQVTPCVGPPDGTIVFTDGTGAVLAQGAATACGNCQIGLTVTFSAQGGTYGIGYGPHSVTASYSGSSNGFWLPSKATANYVIPSTCNQQSIIQEIMSQQNQLDAQLSSDAQYMSSMVQGAMGQMVNMGQSSSCSGNCGTTVTYTPGGCTGNACMSSTPCTSGNCGSANPSITGSIVPSLSGSLGSLSGSGVPGSYYNGGCNNGNCGAVSSIG